MTRGNLTAAVRALGAIRARIALVCSIYIALAYLSFWPVGPFDDARVIACGCYDVAAQSWYMAWTPHALVSGLNPFFSSALNVPDGVNLASNTAMPLLGFVSAPVTWLFGPFASFNALMRLAFCLSAITMFVLLRRWVRSLFAAFLGGLFYGFSPYMFAQGALHLNLAFIALPPLIALLLDEIIAGHRWSPRPSGIALGVLCAAQYLISPEILADVVLVTAVVCAGLAVKYRHVLRTSGQRYLTALAWSLLPFVVICGYASAFALSGSQHVQVEPTVIYGNSTFRADLFSSIAPTTGQLFGPRHLEMLASNWVGANVNENDIYLGLPLVTLFLLTIAFVRKAIVRVLVLGAAASFVLSLGPRLMIGGQSSGIWLPFSLVQKLPIFQIEVPARYAALTDLCVIAVVVIGIDHLINWCLASRSNSRSERFHRSIGAPQIAGAAMSGMLLVATMVSFWPREPIRSASTNVPKYFETSAVDRIPKGSTVLAYPYPIRRSNYAMAWQVEARFRFNIIGGYALFPFQTVGPPGVGLGGGLDPPTLSPSFVEAYFEDAFNGATSSVPRPSPAAFAATRRFIRRFGVETIVVDRVGRHPRQVVRFFTAMFRRAPSRYGTLDIWYQIRR